jgi:hypothetical protein
MIDPARIPKKTSESWRFYCSQRLESMRDVRQSWWAHWKQLSDLFLPRRYRFFVDPNQYNRGTQINNIMQDETGELAARTLSTGLLANLTSPTKPWFAVEIAGIDMPDEGPVAEWCAEVTKRILEVYAGSNFYQTYGTNYEDVSVFGSACNIQYEDPETVVHFFAPCMGEFFFGLNAKLEVESLYREFTYTVRQVVEEFGMENVSESTRSLYRTGGTSADREVVICHAIEPNVEIYQSGEACGFPVSTSYLYREMYWERGSAEYNNVDKIAILRAAGFRERPFATLRWSVTSNDPYGRSPGMDALGAVRQLQVQQRRKAEAIDKMVRPPMVASLAMKNEPMDIMPGGVSFTANPSGDGFKPAFQVDPRINELKEDIIETQNRIRSIFYNDLFRPALDEAKVQTATYWEAVEQEKLVLLGPVVERIESEGLEDTILRTYAIMTRRKLLPPPPPEVADAPIAIRYIGLLAEAQRAASTAAIERLFAFAGNLVPVVPGIMDNLDGDAAVEEYAEQLKVPPRILRAVAQVAAIRAQQAQREAEGAALTSGATLAAGAKTLSETDVGGGQNALQMVLQ